ncbi:hypothetical protein KY389_00970 [Paracoccus bogoriensis]|uniref:hypothetical protein n=1 Tax=Paracoccus bogoriensis TaxID=242065 RepID=UPI001CA4E9F1|nr:hypothetical protein [Paracoccus bogoriensis]MBW7055264.1 hypothetical protein [Paracoccus bogoriensis]
MNRSEFVAATAIILFAAFLLGWFACWLVGRLTRPSQAEIGELHKLAAALQEAESRRDAAEALLAEREAEAAGRLAGSEAELRATMEALRDARSEIEELRDYIERALARR